MNNKEINKIIANYKPHPGFFDLSQKPKKISRKTYAQILKLQNFLAEENQKKDYYQEPYNRHQWDRLTNLAAELQLIIFRHWGEEVFEVEGLKRNAVEVTPL